MRAVIFDLGKVLVNYEHGTTMTAVARLGQSSPEQVSELFRQVDKPFGVGQIETADIHRFYQQQTALTATVEEFLTAFCAGLSRIDEALAYALELQRRPGITVGVISNTNEAHVTWLDEYLPELAEFDLVMMSNEVGLAKPDPELFQLALELLDVPAQRAILIDDVALNVAAAQTLGLHGIVHTDWAITRPALEDWLAASASDD